MSLYLRMLRLHLMSITAFSFISALYMLLIIWIFPTFADKMDVMNELISSMPAGFIQAFGLEAGMGSLGEFLSSKYYEMIYIIILSIYSITITNQLIAQFIDRGSMAYLLATPFSRTKVALIQFSVFLTGLLVIMIVTTVTGLWGQNSLILSTNQMDVQAFIEVNLLGTLLFFAIGSINFLLSCSFNDEKRALGLASFVIFLMYGFDIVAKLTEKLSWLEYASIFSFFQASDILRSGSASVYSYIGLIIIGLITLSASIWIFKKRDLPL
ncbi:MULTISPECIES: ABC transporter permease subunit [Pontibacillus]|uniref:ABC transporter permease subunit n=1 Tax=Pontibacillus chungwhensis TaxID=265426 RepID=A0ABY8UV79_9BACI|nr:MULTISPECIES: ABC transporter permease subunit [Pontibacillus]MCD5322897.1 ABC transporter permease subunit [Pontibacillus sp. HN14]WIF96294.1 ABC transporter permease subunit [Pontibacillus chungwhensis]